MLENAQPAIDDGELIVGKMSGRELKDAERAEWDIIREYSLPSRTAARGQASHMAVDYDLLLRKGAEGIIADIAGLKGNLDPAIPENLEKIDFYSACVGGIEEDFFVDRKACALARADTPLTRPGLRFAAPTTSAKRNCGK